MTNRWFLASVALCVASAAATGYVWLHRDALLPDPVPVHWGVSGQPDRWVPRDSIAGSLWIMPAVVAGMIVLGRVLPWLSPASFSIEPFRPTYEYIFFLVTGMMVYLQAVIVLTQTGTIGDIGRWIMGGMLVALGAMGNVLGKVQRNFYVGIRTPWTLASDAVWTGTHRMAAWSMVTGSVIGLLTLLLPINPLWSLGVILIAALAPVPYSLWLSKRLERGPA